MLSSFNENRGQNTKDIDKPWLQIQDKSLRKPNMKSKAQFGSIYWLLSQFSIHQIYAVVVVCVGAWVCKDKNIKISQEKK